MESDDIKEEIIINQMGCITQAMINFKMVSSEIQVCLDKLI